MHKYNITTIYVKHMYTKSVKKISPKISPKISLTAEKYPSKPWTIYSTRYGWWMSVHVCYMC